VSSMAPIDLSNLVWTMVIIIIFLVLVYAIIIFNGFVRLKNYITKSLANIDVLLKQRNDEIPMLIETVKGYMLHERSTLEAITKARVEMFVNQSMKQKAMTDKIIREGIKSIFMVAEDYPKLQANQDFLKLQERITQLENQIADRREFYNDSVTRNNIRVESFPDLIIAKVFGFSKKELFDASAPDPVLKKPMAAQ
jgi:LemA protein